MIEQSSNKITAVTVQVFAPLILGGWYIKSLDEELSSYSHDISIDGGFIECRISMNTSLSSADDWFANGIGRHIVARGIGGEVIWEGFVDNISINMGNITIERGRLTNICNRCSVLYTPIFEYDSSGNPITGVEMPTVVLDDEKSIAKYGIWENVLSGGQLLIEPDPLTGLKPADTLRNTYLEEHKEPEISHTPIINTESGSDITVNLDCKGYIEWVNNYVYNNEAEEPFSVTISSKIATVLAADPNSIISTDINNIKENGLLTGLPENEDRKALEIINEIVGMGGASYEKWIFGIYEDRKAYYQPFSSSVDYMCYVSGGIQRITGISEEEIQPWNVRPGKIVFFPDINLGSIASIPYNSDPRIMYLEKVTFTAPNSISLQGKKIYTFDQMMNQFGLSGGY